MNLTGKRIEIDRTIRHWRDTPAAAMAHDMNDTHVVWEEVVESISLSLWTYAPGVRVATASKRELKD